MRVVKVLASMLGLVLLVPLSIVLLGAAAQSPAGLAAVFVVVCIIGTVAWLKQDGTVTRPGLPPDHVSVRLAEAGPQLGRDGELRESPRYSDHLLSGGTELDFVPFE